MKWLVAFCLIGIVIVGLVTVTNTQKAPSAAAARADEKMKASADFDGLRLDNASGQSFSQCSWTLNGKYELGGNPTVDPVSVTYPWGGFSDDEGNRFRFPEQAPKSIHIHCSEPSTLSLYRSW